MTERTRVPIALLPTGVPGLDEILGGGLPEYSFNLIAGTPGSGKTTLAHQIMFALATPARPALYFTLIGEPPLKMLRYQQQYGFFDPAAVGDSIHFIDLSDLTLGGELERVLAAIIERVEAVGPGLVIVDSFQTIVRTATGAGATGGPMSLQHFVQRLAVNLTSWQATTVLIGEYGDDELRGNPVFTVADGIIALTQVASRNSSVRKLQVVKSRGQAPMPGLHTFRITAAGIQVFPRITSLAEANRAGIGGDRLVSGVAGLDTLLDGGIPAGDAILVTGPSGTGKSALATQFIAAGAAAGEPGVIAVFEEHPREYLQRAATFGLDLTALVDSGTLAIIYIRPLDLSPDETLHEIREAVRRVGARRVVIDSVSGFELALAPSFREDFRESFYRLVGALTGTGMTVLLTVEIAPGDETLRFSPYIVSFLADDIVLLRYEDDAGELRKSLSVVKMRNSDHSKGQWRYEVTGQGVVVRERLHSRGALPDQQGLTEREMTVWRALLELGEASAATLARRTGLPDANLAAALDRLVSLDLAIAVAWEGETTFRPIAQARGG